MVTRTAQGHLTITRQRDGKDGTNGSNGTSVLAQYSTDGSSWHTTFATGDYYMRTSSDSGTTWSSAIRIVGESGTNGSYIEYSFAISAQTETTNVTTAPVISGSWSDAPLSVTTSCPYLWCRMISVAKDGTKAAARYVRITGEKGAEGTTIQIKGHVSTYNSLPTSGVTSGDAYVTDDTGHLWVYTESGSFADVGQFKGDAGDKAYVHIAYSNSADGSTDFTTDDSKADGHTYIGTYADNTESDSENASDYHWQKVQGEQGASILAATLSSAPSYNQTTWNTISVTGTSRTWSNVTNASSFRVGDIAIISGTISDLNSIRCLYYGKVTAVGTSTITTSAITYTASGSDGVGVSYVDVEYAQNQSATTAPTSTSDWSTSAPEWKNGYYIWSRTCVRYTDADEDVYSEPVCISGKQGNTGNGISSITEQYYLSIYPNSLSGGSWSDTSPTWTDGTFVWTRSKIVYTNGTTTYTTAACVTGNTGVSVSSITREYYKSTSATSLVGGSWSTTSPTWTDGTYIWVRDLITYSDGVEEYTNAWNSTGAQGEKGNTGTSVSSVTPYYAASALSSGVTRTNTSGWSTTFPTPTLEKPYIWRYLVTTLDNGTTQTSNCELISIYQSGANPNLLDDTSFESDYGLENWLMRSHYSAQTGVTPTEETGVGCNASGVLGLNSYYDKTTHTYNQINYKEILEQVVYSADGTIRKLDPSTYYTLSFWLKGNITPVEINQTSSAYGFATRELYLTAGQTYNFYVTGCVNTQARSDGKTLRVYVYHENWGSGGSAYAETGSTTISMLSITFTPKVTGKYYITSYLHDNSDASSTGTATVLYYATTQTNYLTTYVYPSCIDTAQTILVDGVATTGVGSDLGKSWPLSTTWTKHTITFKTKSSISTADQKVLFRLLPSLIEGQTLNVWICAPKLEIGMIATAYMDSSKSLQGAQLRVTQWETGKQYLSGRIGEAYHDIVYSNGSVFDCITSHISGETLPENDTTNWKQGDQRELVATKVLLAQNAMIDILSGNQITIYDNDGNITGGVQGNPNLPIFWAGADTPSDGTWQQNIDGSALYGDPNGERIELNPNDKSLRFFNSSGSFVSEHNAKSVSSLSNILPSGGAIPLLDTANENHGVTASATIWYGIQGSETFALSDIWQQSGSGIATLYIKYLSVIISTTNTAASSATPYGSFTLGIEKYSDAAATDVVTFLSCASVTIYSQCDGQTRNHTITEQTRNISLTSGYYYRIVAKLSYFGGGTSNVTTLRGVYNLGSASVATNVYSSQFFGNGLALSKSTDEYFAAMLETISGAQHMRMAIANALHGINVTYADGIQIKRSSYWHKQPLTLLALRVTGSSSGVTINANLTGVSLTANSSSATATGGAVQRVDEGRYRVWFPTNWLTYAIGQKGMAQATAIAADDTSGQGWFARIGIISNYYVDVITADDASGNDGSFMLEVKI